jgi:hypothetical protein
MQVENIGDTSSSFRTNRWRINNPCHIYNTVTTTERMNVIADINTGNLRSECKSGKINKWWTCKHHPNEEIPKNIYLLGGGMTLKALHEQYHSIYETPPSFLRRIIEVLRSCLATDFFPLTHILIVFF